jgi:hypothetical protein
VQRLSFPESFFHKPINQQNEVVTMKYQKTLNIWNLSQEERRALPAGQWIRAGESLDPHHRGIWCGVSPSGSDVAVWMGNIKGLKGEARAAHIQRLMDYAKGGAS